MIVPPDIQRRLSAFLDDEMSLRAPDDVVGDVLAAVGRTRRRPGWRILERWIPMPITLRLAVVPRAVIYLFLLALLAAMLAAGDLIVGSSHAVVSVPVPSPTGLARNGLITWDQQGDIWVAEPDGSHPRPLIVDETIDIDPTWSPDGRHLAFWALADQRTDEGAMVTLTEVSNAIQQAPADLVVVAADGTGRRSIVEGVTMDPIGAPPSWSRDSTHLAYSHLGPDGVALATVSLDGTPPVELWTLGHAPTWSPDGSLLAFGGPSGYDGLRLMEPVYHTGKVRSAHADSRAISTAAGTGQAFSLSDWSPDGTLITYFAGDDGGGHDIWVVGTNGLGQRIIGSSPADDAWPAWSPDGAWIAYQHAVGGLTDWRIMVTDPSGTNSRTVEDAPILAGAPMTWSPDGTRVIGFGPRVQGVQDVATTLSSFDALGSTPAIVIAVDSPFWSSSWQRLAP